MLLLFIYREVISENNTPNITSRVFSNSQTPSIIIDYASHQQNPNPKVPIAMPNNHNVPLSHGGILFLDRIFRVTI